MGLAELMRELYSLQLDEDRVLDDFEDQGVTELALRRFRQSGAREDSFELRMAVLLDVMDWQIEAEEALFRETLCSVHAKDLKVLGQRMQRLTSLLPHWGYRRARLELDDECESPISTIALRPQARRPSAVFSDREPEHAAR